MSTSRIHVNGCTWTTHEVLKIPHLDIFVMSFCILIFWSLKCSAKEGVDWYWLFNTAYKPGHWSCGPRIDVISEILHYCDTAILVQVCAGNRKQHSYDLGTSTFASLSEVACALGSSISATVFTFKFVILQVSYSCTEWKDVGPVPAAHQVAVVLLIRQEERCFQRFFSFASCCCLLRSRL